MSLRPETDESAVSYVEGAVEAVRRIGYERDGPEFTTGRPDRKTLSLVSRTGQRIVAKLYPAGGGERAYSHMRALWNSAFGKQRTPPGLPRPLRFLDNIGVVLMERIDGTPLSELVPNDEATLSAVIRLLAELHGCGLRPAPCRDSRRIARSIRRKAASVAERAPHLAVCYQEATTALEAAVGPDTELVPSHGDFTPRNILVASVAMTLIDWDRFQLADPARDLANIGCWYWMQALREGRSPDWAALHVVTKVYSALRPQARIGSRLDFHIAAGLLRKAHSLVTLWPQYVHLVPQVTTEVLTRLRRIGR